MHTACVFFLYAVVNTEYLNCFHKQISVYPDVKVDPDRQIQSVVIIIMCINITRALQIIPPILVKNSSRDNLLCHSFTRKKSAAKELGICSILA